MSIISNFTAEPNRLEMVVKYLKSTKKQYTKQELEDVFSPSNARGSSSVFREVFTVLESLDLLKTDNDFIKLNLPKTKQPINVIIRDAIFNKEFSNKDDFSLALSWFQSQNSIKNLDWSDNVTNIVNSDLNDNYNELDLTNNSRWQHFGYWCIYLGFATKIYIAEKTYLCPDPTEAINNEIKNIFTTNKEIRIKEFFLALSNVLPVLDYGNIRIKINESIREGLQLPEDTLSKSTSLALLRLESRNIIKLAHKADADSLLITDGSKNKTISHISYLGK